jgi:hypothetical protein
MRDHEGEGEEDGAGEEAFIFPLPLVHERETMKENGKTVAGRSFVSQNIFYS